MSKRLENFYSFSLAKKNKNLKPTQYSISDRFFIQFGNFEKGFREIKGAFLYPNEIVFSREKDEYIEDTILRFEVARRKKNVYQVKYRARKKLERKKSKSQIIKEKLLEAQKFKIAEARRVKREREKRDKLVEIDEYKKDLAYYRSTIKDDDEDGLLDYYLEKYFGKVDDIEILDYRIEDGKFFITAIKNLEGQGPNGTLTVAQEYLFYLDSQELNPNDTTLYEHQRGFIKQESHPLSNKLMSIKSDSKDYIYRILLTMENAEGKAASQGFSGARERNLLNSEDFEDVFDKTLDYFVTKDGRKYLTLYTNFQLNGYMIERTIDKIY